MELGNEFGIKKIRVPLEPLPPAKDVSADRMSQLKFYHQSATALKDKAAKARFKTTDFFRGLNLGDNFDENTAAHLFGSLENGVTEIMTHPGFADPNEGGFSGAKRETELQTLLGDKTARILNDQQVHLIHFGDL